MAYVICGMMDQGFKDFQLEAAISKIYASVRFNICFVFLVFRFSTFCSATTRFNKFVLFSCSMQFVVSYFNFWSFRYKFHKRPQFFFFNNDFHHSLKLEDVI